VNVTVVRRLVLLLAGRAITADDACDEPATAASWGSTQLALSPSKSTMQSPDCFKTMSDSENLYLLETDIGHNTAGSGTRENATRMLGNYKVISVECTACHVTRSGLR
jgi:hypothetical protein